jgi:predicted nucleic acid-binding protein
VERSPFLLDSSETLWHMDEPTLLTAARFKAEHKLSLADALIAAFGRTQDAILLHKDPEFESLVEHVGLEALPYKNGLNG